MLKSSSARTRLSGGELGHCCNPSSTHFVASGVFKPLILAKVGRSEAGRRAAASHTGALAHSGAVDDAIFRHHGIMRGEDLDHMLDIAAAFAFCKLPRGNRVAVITGSGGSAVWMSDILSAHGLELPVLEEELQQRLMALLPSYASAQNPVDGTAQAIHEVGYAKLVEIVRESQRIDTILLIGSLANEGTAKTRADLFRGQRYDRADDPTVDLYHRHRRDHGGFRRGWHPLLYFNAELRPRDPGIGRLRRVPGAAAAAEEHAGNGVGAAPRSRRRVGRCGPGAYRGRGQGLACSLWGSSPIRDASGKCRGSGRGGCADRWCGSPQGAIA